MLNNKEAKMSKKFILKVELLDDEKFLNEYYPGQRNWNWWVEEGKCTALEGKYTFPRWGEEGRCTAEESSVNSEL
jgi:hypothetical protein